MNRYLEKIASQKERTKKQAAGELALAAAGASLVSDAPSRLLGYHNVYHGTNKEKGKSIRESGFKSNLGGTGAASASERFRKNSAGKVHVTKNKSLARMYAGDPAYHIEQIKKRDGFIFGTGEAVRKAHIDGLKGKGDIVKARVPHSVWEKMKVDKDSSHGAPENPIIQAQMKARAATYDKNIGSQFIKGGKGSKGATGFFTKNNLRRYYGSTSGKKRAAIGALNLALGSSAIGYAAHLNKSKGGILAGDK